MRRFNLFLGWYYEAQGWFRQIVVLVARRRALMRNTDEYFDATLVYKPLHL